ncbi:hypothetical protein V8C42DRAFT_326738 [Trichoderma barbatum]
MSEAENPGDASDQQSIAIADTEGEMNVGHFRMEPTGVTSFDFEIGGTVCPGFEIGWVSSIKIRFYHGNILIGETFCPDLLIVPDNNNYWEILLDDDYNTQIHIKNMVGFKYFFDEVMPKAGANYDIDCRKSATAALSVSANGHRLTMSIDLATMPRLRPTVESMILSGNELKISITIENSGPLTLLFDGMCSFILKQGQKLIGELDIENWRIGPGKKDLVLRGDILEGVSGMAVLKGDNFFEHSAGWSWQRYAFKSFEVDINLDEMVVDGKITSESKVKE